MVGARKGKQCPGGYWIPRNKQCGKPGPKMPGPKMAGAKRLRTGGAARPSGGMGRKALLAAGIAGGVGLYAKSEYDIRKQRQQIAERNAAQAAKKQAMATTQAKKPSAPKPKDPAVEKIQRMNAETKGMLSKLEKDFAETEARMRAEGYDMSELDKSRKKKDSRAVFDACEGIREKARFDAIVKGKKCPGGYSIPANKQCGGKKMRSPGGGGLRSAATIGTVGALAIGGSVMAAKAKREAAERDRESDRQLSSLVRQSSSLLRRTKRL